MCIYQHRPCIAGRTVTGPPVESRFRDCANRQNQSPLFSKLPGELRNQVYATALLSSEDFDNPSVDSRNSRPGDRFQKRIAGFLLTCRQAYLETHRLTVHLNEHGFCLLTGRRCRCHQFCHFPANIYQFFDQLTEQQTLDASSIRLQMNFLWENTPMHELNLLSRKAVKHLRVTISTDAWCWESADPDIPDFQSKAAEAIHWYKQATAAIMLAYPLNSSSSEGSNFSLSPGGSAWVDTANGILLEVEYNQGRVELLPTSVIGREELRTARGLQAKARKLALEGLKIFDKRLPEEGPDARVLDLPLVPHLSLDLFKKKPISITRMDNMIRRHNLMTAFNLVKVKADEIEEGSFASYLSKISTLETFTIEFDTLDFFRPRLQKLVDYARTWIFSLNPAEESGNQKGMEMRVITNTEVEEWDAFDQGQVDSWTALAREKDFQTHRTPLLERRAMDKAITMRLVWQAMPIVL